MPAFRVVVTASYAPSVPATSLTGHVVLVQPKSWRKCLGDWISEDPPPGETRSLAEDASIDPPRLTLTVIYDDIDAPTEWDARADARSRFREASAAADLPEPETILAELDIDW